MTLGRVVRPPLLCGDRRFVLGERTLVMGIVNVTPDSFSDGGRFASAAAAVDHAQRLLDEGADVLDIGGESTRPGAAAVDLDEERRRVLPVVEALVGRGITNLSIDTRHAVVAAEALAAGARWINDVSAFADPAMPAACTAAEATILMHWDGDDAGVVADVEADAAELVTDVCWWLARRVALGVVEGLDPRRLLVDPGLGFSKTLADNVALTNGLLRLRDECGGAGVVYGPSRKRFLGTLTGRAEAHDRDAATVGAVVYAALNGADIVRVHDVKSCVDALKVVAALRAGR